MGKDVGGDIIAIAINGLLLGDNYIPLCVDCENDPVCGFKKGDDEFCGIIKENFIVAKHNLRRGK